VVGVAGLEGEHDLDVGHGEDEAGPVVLDGQDVEPEVGDHSAERGQRARAVVEQDPQDQEPARGRRPRLTSCMSRKGVDVAARASPGCCRTVLNRPVPDPFLAATSWHVDKELDLAAMRLASDPLSGEHDFTSFRRAPKGTPSYSMVRRVTDARWLDLGEGVLRFDIEASSFCQQMVRSVVGTIVEMGTGQRRAGEMASIVRARQRSSAARVAPPHGLYLWEIIYPLGTVDDVGEHAYSLS
jgi:hypothetical protein